MRPSARFSAEIRFISSSLSVKSNTLKLSAIRSGLDERGIAPTPCCSSQRRHGFGERNLRIGPMHQQQIDIVGAERLETRVDRLGEIRRMQILVRRLGGEENVFPGHA